MQSCFRLRSFRAAQDYCSWIGALLILAVAWGVAGTMSAQAQRPAQSKKQLEGVGVTQKLGTTLPTTLTFRNENGDEVQLEQYFDGERPVVLTLNYHRCPMLCKVQLRKFAAALGDLSWTPGDKFRVLTVDINPDEGPEAARTAQERYRGAFDRPEEALAGWHFLTGEASAIQALADSVGFRYRRLPDRSEQFAHPSTVIFLSGSGTVTRYFTTLEPAPGDMRTALVEASNGTIGSVSDKVFLACAQFDPDSNSYSASALKVMQYGSGLLALIMGVTLFVFWRRENEQLEAAEEEVLETAFDGTTSPPTRT